MISRLYENLDGSISANWTSRPERSGFVKRLANVLGAQSILNVGSGGARELARAVAGDIKVFDIDMAGDCDLKIDLDAVEALPFNDEEFDFVCSMDVLEHLESFHQINQELLRVSRRYVLVSLPNSACEIVNIILNKSSFGSDSERGYYSKYYGLPLVVPEDRHRWWLYPQDIVRFYEHFSANNKCGVKYFLPRRTMKGRVLELLLGRRIFTTFLTPHIAVLLDKYPNVSDTDSPVS